MSIRTEEVLGDVTLKYGTDGHKWLIMGLDSIFSFAQIKIVFMRCIGVDSPADTKFPVDRNLNRDMAQCISQIYKPFNSQIYNNSIK